LDYIKIVDKQIQKIQNNMVVTIVGLTRVMALHILELWIQLQEKPKHDMLEKQLTLMTIFLMLIISHNKLQNCKILKEVLLLDYTPI
jgi:hypothetical protein